MNSFGERLKILRKEVNITQAALAEKLNVHLQTISKWERGKSEPDISQMGELAKILQVSIEKLFGVTESEQTYDGIFSAENLGLKISSLRTTKNESQEQLAQAIEISADAVSRWERGITCPDIEKLVALSVHYDLPISKLYYGIIEETSPSSVVYKKKSRKNILTWISSAVALLSVCALFLVLFLQQTNSDPAASYEYYIDYWLNGGSFETNEVQTVFAAESGDISLPAPIKKGTTFEGWYLTNDYSGNSVEQITCKGENVRLYAKWSDDTYTIRYELNGGVLYENNPSTVSSESEIALNNPIRKGYLFLGWYDILGEDEKYSIVGGSNAKNLTLSAVWQKSEAIFNIEYHLDGGELTESNPEKVTAGERHALNQPTKIGCDFVGWNSKSDGSGEFYEYLLGIQSDLELYALYEPRQFLVRYEYDGIYEDGLTNPNYITFGEMVTLNPVIKYGYNFMGWFDDANNGNQISVIDKSNILDINVLYARFTPIVYQIVLDADGGTITTSDGERQHYTYELKFNEKLTLPECSKGGYVFLGWINQSGEKITEINSLNIADMTLIANWRESDKRYSITYELDGGVIDEENPTSVLCGQVIGLHEPQKENYIFLGWYDNADGTGNKYEFTPSDRETDLMLYAIWQEIKISGSYTDFVYEKNLASGTVTITGYNGAYGENIKLIIPSVIKGLPVVAIEGMRENDLTSRVLNSLIIPEGIVELGKNALRNLSIHNRLIIPASVETIGENCFQQCSFKELCFAPNSKLVKIKQNGFERISCDNIIHLPENLEELGYRSFYISRIVGIILPDSLKRINTGALLLNSEGAAVVGLNAKDNITNGYNFYIPANVEFIGTQAISTVAYCTRIFTPLTEEEANERYSPHWYYGDQNNVHGSADVYYGVNPAEITLNDDGKTTKLTGNAFELPTPQKDNKTFIGWRLADGRFVNQYCIMNKDCELVAVYEDINEHDGRTIDRVAYLKSDTVYEFDVRGGGLNFYFKLDDISAKTVVIDYACGALGNASNAIYFNDGNGIRYFQKGQAVAINSQGYFYTSLPRYLFVTHFKISISIID